MQMFSTGFFPSQQKSQDDKVESLEEQMFNMINEDILKGLKECWNFFLKEFLDELLKCLDEFLKNSVQEFLKDSVEELLMKSLKELLKKYP